jgi:hypothetical protein
MDKLIIPPKTGVDPVVLELGVALGRSHTFGLVAGRCSAAQADRIIRLLEEFGPTFFELSQMIRIPAGTFRAIAPV